jgi:spermidine/putrescine transport system permease protein
MRNRKKFFLEELSFLLASPALAWQIFFLVVPLMIIFYYAILIQPGEFGFTLDYFLFFLKHNYFFVLLRTVTCALLVSILCLFLAFPVAYFLATHISDRFKNIFLFFFTLPFWTNFLILVYSWFFLLDRYGLINSILMKIGIVTNPSLLANNMIAVVLVMVYCYLPFMLLPLYSSMGKITQDVIEASLDLGASWIQTFRFVVIPLSWSGIKTGFLLVLVPAFGEFAIPSLIGGAKKLFVGSLMTHYFLIMHDPSRGSAFTIISLFALFITVGILYTIVQYTQKYKKGVS